MTDTKTCVQCHSEYVGDSEVDKLFDALPNFKKQMIGSGICSKGCHALIMQKTLDYFKDPVNKNEMLQIVESIVNLETEALSNSPPQNPAAFPVVQVQDLPTLFAGFSTYDTDGDDEEDEGLYIDEV